jgi:hypothetical protein
LFLYLWNCVYTGRGYYGLKFPLIVGYVTYRFFGDVLRWEALLGGGEGAHGVEGLAAVALLLLGQLLEPLSLHLEVLGQVFVSENDVIRVHLLVGVESVQVGVDLESPPIVSQGRLRRAILELVVEVVHGDRAVLSNMAAPIVEVLVVIGGYPIESARAPVVGTPHIELGLRELGSGHLVHGRVDTPECLLLSHVEITGSLSVPCLGPIVSHELLEAALVWLDMEVAL